MKKLLLSFMFIGMISVFLQAQTEDATISADEITYWIGEGPNQAILVVNWCEPEIAFAWGYRFTEESIIVSNMMDAIAAADSRFQFEGGGGVINNITYNDDNYQLTLTGDYWMYNLNGQTAALGYESQEVVDGDIVKWGDNSCAITDENWNFTWTTEIQPVTDPNPEHELFDGIVGTPGCQGIYCENPAIIGWATTCQINRGYQNIVNSGLLASYGTEEDAIGPATTSTTTVVSLGDSGVAILTFDQPIVNGNGYDFAVFENALNDTFLELAFVEVSSDGINYVRFPATSYTPTNVQISNAGSVDATHINQLSGKYRAGWGTPFDLEVLSDSNNLDINNITHIKLIDVIGTIDPAFGSRDHLGNLINDPYPTDFASCGFDLAGVAIMNGWLPNSITESNPKMSQLSVYPNPCNDVITIQSKENDVITLYNMQGVLLYQIVASGETTTLNMQNYPTGIYLMKNGNNVAKIVKE